MEYAESCAQARQVAAELHSIRRDFISQASSTIFPIEVEALSQQDAGEAGKGKGGGVEGVGKGRGEKGEGRRERGREGRRKREEVEGKGKGGRVRENGAGVLTGNWMA